MKFEMNAISGFAGMRYHELDELLNPNLTDTHTEGPQQTSLTLAARLAKDHPLERALRPFH